jgi:hypothetical protein
VDLLKCCEGSGACQVCVVSTELVSWVVEIVLRERLEEGT